MSTRISESKPRARKVHQCDLCYLHIPIGTVYVRSVCVDGGDIYAFRNHVECEAEASAQNEWEWPPGMLIEYCADEALSDEWKAFYHKMKYGTEVAS